MADANDPAGYSRQAERGPERIRGTFTDPISTEILQTVKAGRRGRLGGDGWSATTVRNNSQRFRILHTAFRNRNDLSNRLFGLSIDEINDLIDELIDSTRHNGTCLQRG